MRTLTVEELRLRGFTKEEFEQARAAYTAEVARRSGSRSFSAFVQQAWQYVPQADPLVWSWHMEVICRHLEEVARGGIKRLVINLPPGHAKSILLSVLWPAWIWTWWPKCQFLCGTHSADFSSRDAMRSRAVIESDWYRQTYSRPGGWTLRRDQNAKHWFVNTLGGERFSTGIGGVGRRAHIIIVDDPIDPKDRHSKAKIQAANDWLGATLSQRLVKGDEGRVVMIMQRLSVNDPTQFLLSGGDFEHLALASEHDPEHRSTTYHEVEGPDGKVERKQFWTDHRQAGELLFEVRFSKALLDSYKLPNKLGPDGYAAQHGQAPRSFAGGMFKRLDWRFYSAGPLADTVGRRPPGCDASPAVPLPAQFDAIVMAADCAFKDNPKGSRVAIHVWGAAGPNRYLLYRHTAHMTFGATKAAILHVYNQYAHATRFLVEDAANGPAIIDELKAVVPRLMPVPARGSKGSRWAAVQPYQQAHNCYIPDGVADMDDFVGSMADLTMETEENSDDGDAFSHALLNMEPEREAETGRVNWRRR